MEDYVGLPDLRQLIVSSTPFCAMGQFPEPLFPLHSNLTPPPPGSSLHHLPVEVDDNVSLGGGGLLVDHRRHHHRHRQYTGMVSGGALFGMDQLEKHGWNINNNNIGIMIGDGFGGDNNNVNSRWPRQETLTLLEVRSALDPKFKQTNQKGPLWDEVSRIMAEEHGFQRSGKKCKEKFENLYKYYKKTKEGKAGRHDGKNYRFFRQLEAIYGDPQARNQDHPVFYQTPKDHIVKNPDQNQESRKLITSESRLSFSSNYSTELDQTASSEINGDDIPSLSSTDFMNIKNVTHECARPVKKSWKAKMEEFVSSQIGKVIESQEAWMDKMVMNIENREEERIAREEEWRKKEAVRFEQQVHEFWAKERAWVEARDAAVMEALSQFTCARMGRM